MKPRLPPSRALQVSNPGPNGFVLLGPTQAPTRKWKFRLPKLRRARAIIVTVLVLAAALGTMLVWHFARTQLTAAELRALYDQASSPTATVAERRQCAEILQRQSFAGDTEAMSLLACCYKKGCGVVRSDALGFAWLSIWCSRQPGAVKSIPLGDPSPMQLESQRLAVELEKKVRWRAKPDAKNQTAEESPAGKKPPAGTPPPAQQTPAVLSEIASLRAKAEQGDAAAQNSLALTYCNSANFQDYSKAVTLFQNAALQGHAEAQYHLGVLYANGMGVPKDETKAVEWYKKSAALKNEDAISTLERLYNYRTGAPRNDANPSTFTHSTAPATNSTGDDATLRHLATDDRLRSGSLLVDRLRNEGGKGKLTLENGLAEDAYVKLVRNGKLVAGFYVRSKDNSTYSTIPDGTFSVLYCTGFGWDANGRSFARGRHARRYDEPLTYLTSQVRDSTGVTTRVTTHWHDWTLTLHAVYDGNAKTTDVSLEEFDRY